MPKRRLKPFVSLAVIAAAVLVCMPTSSAVADDANTAVPDATRGQKLAGRLCVNCHATTVNNNTQPSPADVPSFTEIANKKNQTAQHIRNTLINPHPPMPDVSLTRLEIEDLIAYVDSLRDPESGRKLLPDINKEPPKPEYPDHS